MPRLTHAELDALLRSRPAILAPMEDVSDAVFRSICRSLGAHLCVTEFVNVEGLMRGCRIAKRKITLGEHDHPTAIQIYGADAKRLAEAAEIAARAEPAYLDVNCGCWVPKIAGRGAGAAWLRDPKAMVAMAKLVVDAVKLPVTVKTRLGWDGTTDGKGEMPIVDLAPALEDVGVRAITIHCRTAKMGHSGAADWSWAAKARARVKIPIIVNGDVKSGDDAARALETTGCEAVMVGRRAIDHPWIFREIRARLDRGETIAPPSSLDRIALAREHLIANVAVRGAPRGVYCTRRHLAGYLRGIPGAASLRHDLNTCDDLDGCLAILARAEERVRAGLDGAEAA